MSGMEQEDFVFLEALNQRGTVFLARQRSSGRILVARQVSGGQTEIFETLRAMNAKHVPAVRAIEARQDGTAFVYEDYIQGVTLRQRMEEGPPLTREDAVWLGRQLCQALAPLHRENIVHRDIKPENIVLGADSQVYLIDFGIARFEKAGRSADTTLLGTHGYAAPEQFGFCQSDARADIYSLGVVLNQVVTGAFPNAARADGLLGEVIARCTNLDPQQRYSNVRELDAALAALPCRRAVPPRPAARTGYPYPLCLVPGFRSGSGQKALAAVAAAFWFFVFAAAGYSTAAGDPVECLIVTGVLAIPVGSYVLVFDLFGIQRHIPILNKAQSRGMRIAATAAAVLLWAAAAFLITVLASAALKAVLQ